ncbi:MAG TPA: hypothetical protein VLC09_15900 [Polyangiaceae bacterium]|nr:hypothetical protein [Polyangiaceae bacterium]
MKKTPLLLATFTLLGSPALAVASPSYPSVVADELNMLCTPQCTICHESNPGNGGNAHQPFVENLGKPGDDDELRDYLQRLEDDSDIDGDGIADKAELAADPPTDPNDPSNETEVCQPDTKYGCGAASIAPSPQAGSQLYWALGLGLTVLGYGVRRRRTPT